MLAKNRIGLSQDVQPSLLAKGTIVNRRNYMKCFDGESREVSTECHNTFRGVGKKGFFDDKSLF